MKQYGRCVIVSFHQPGQTFRPKTLRSMIEEQARWTNDDLIRLGLLKKYRVEHIGLIEEEFLNLSQTRSRARAHYARPAPTARVCGQANSRAVRFVLA